MRLSDGTRIALGRGILTARKVTILKLVVSGYTNLEIARRMGLEEDTIKTHVRQIMDRFKLEGRTNRSRQFLVVIAYETGIVEPGEIPLPEKTERMFM